QMLGEAKRANCSRPTAAKAHSIAAEPVLRMSQGALRTDRLGSPARRRRRLGLMGRTTGAPSKRSVDPTRAWYTPGRRRWLVEHHVAPTTGLPRESTPMVAQNIGKPLTKLLVPSIGSI